MTAPDDRLDPTQVAELLGWKRRRTVIEHVSDGTLIPPTGRDGRTPTWARSEIEAWAETRPRAAAAPFVVLRGRAGVGAVTQDVAVFDARVLDKPYTANRLGEVRKLRAAAEERGVGSLVRDCDTWLDRAKRRRD